LSQHSSQRTHLIHLDDGGFGARRAPRQLQRDLANETALQGYGQLQRVERLGFELKVI
jgi:hypothetical protein